MSVEFKQYKRKGLSEMIPFNEFVGQEMSSVSVSDQDKLLSNEEFSQGYIARNPKNHADMWYVAKKYFDDNLELADTPSPALQDAVKEFQIDFGVHVRCHVEIRNGFIAVIMAVDGYGNPIESKDVFISPMQITSPSA